MNKKCKLIVFTGGCFSGKTTTMGVMKELFEKYFNINTIILKEPIRDYPGSENISELRKNREEYLNMQIYTTNQRIDMTLSALEKYKDSETVILIDRGLADCMFYAMYYIHGDKLTEESRKKYNTFLRETENTALTKFYNGVYDYVLEFKPLEINATEEDKKFRPVDIDEKKYIESNLIHAWNKKFCENNNVKWDRLDLNRMTNEDLNDYIKDLANEIKKSWKN